jgi:hypothetical protein
MYAVAGGTCALPLLKTITLLRTSLCMKMFWQTGPGFVAGAPRINQDT